MRFKHAHQPINRVHPRRGNITRMIYSIARILQKSRHVRHGRAIRIPVERRLTLENRGVRQGDRVDALGLIRYVADG